MRSVNQIPVFIFAFVSLLSCTNNDQRVQKNELIPTDTFSIPDNYNLEIRPSTKIKCDMITDRPKEEYIKNRLYYVVNADDRPSQLRLQAVDTLDFRHRSLWPCNLPNLVAEGDTILVSGQSYIIFSNEQMRGLPFVIDRFFIHSDYSRGLNVIFD